MRKVHEFVICYFANVPLMEYYLIYNLFHNILSTHELLSVKFNNKSLAAFKEICKILNTLLLCHKGHNIMLCGGSNECPP